MRDIDTFSRTSILENTKNLHKMAIKSISAQWPFPRAFAYFTKVNYKIAEYSYKVSQVLLIFPNLETSNMLNNKHPRKDVNVARLLFKRIPNV